MLLRVAGEATSFYKLFSWGDGSSPKLRLSVPAMRWQRKTSATNEPGNCGRLMVEARNEKVGIKLLRMVTAKFSNSPHESSEGRMFPLEMFLSKSQEDLFLNVGMTSAVRHLFVSVVSMDCGILKEVGPRCTVSQIFPQFEHSLFPYFIFRHCCGLTQVCLVVVFKCAFVVCLIGNSHGICSLGPRFSATMFR